MEEYLNRLSTELGQWPPALVYAVLVLSAFLENVIPPVPGDTVVVFSAYLVGRGILGWWPVYLATCAGGLAGFLAMYYLGYSRGRGPQAPVPKRAFGIPLRGFRQDGVCLMRRGVRRHHRTRHIPHHGGHGCREPPNSRAANQSR